MTMMTMKKAMVAAAGLVIAASAMADATFDELVALSRTPADKTTASNAQALYDDRDTWEPVLSKMRAMIETR